MGRRQGERTMGRGKPTVLAAAVAETDSVVAEGRLLWMRRLWETAEEVDRLIGMGVMGLQYQEVVGSSCKLRREGLKTSFRNHARNHQAKEEESQKAIVANA